MLEESQVCLDVARLVPGLARHVHRELPRRVREVAHRPARPLHGLQLADEDAVHPLAHRLLGRKVRKRRQPLLDLQLPHLARPHTDEAVLARELVVGDRALHELLPVNRSSGGQHHDRNMLARWPVTRFG
jgi:hypothetical protein